MQIDTLNKVNKLDLSPEAIARRYSKSYRGYRLVWYDHVAIPVYVIRLRALVLETKPIAAVDEFLLAGIAAGLGELEELAGFLGLNQRSVERLVRRLISLDIVSVANLSPSRITLSLTAKGDKVLHSAQEIVSREEEITLVIDGLTRSLEAARLGNERASYSSWHDVEKMGLRELPSNPRTHPELEEYVEDLKRKWNGDEDRDCSLIDVVKVLRVERQFRDDAMLLGFAGIDNNVSLCALAVSGHLSPEHTEAFQRVEDKSLRPIASPGGTNLEQFAQRSLPTDLFRMLADHGFEDDSGLDTTSTDARLTSLQQQIATTSSVTERSLLKEQMIAEEEKRAELLAEIESRPVRPISVFEHPALLEQAMVLAAERLLIVSPWIRNAVVNEEFIGRLKAALERNVKVFLGYGIDGKPDSQETEADKGSIEALRMLAAQFDNFKLRRLGDTHAKVLAVDDQFSVVTSFNWLSFKGDPSRKFRDERGVYISLPEFVESLFIDYGGRFGDV